MKFKDLILKLQGLMNDQGERLTMDGDPGPKTQAALEKFNIDVTVGRKITDPPPGQYANEKPVNPAYEETKKYVGQNESNKSFGAFVSKQWARIGRPSIKTIVGSGVAWCALWIGLMNSEVGQEYMIKNGAAAKSYDAYGVAVDWKKDGLPRGAVVRLTNTGSCEKWTTNHVTFADGDCTAEHMTAKSATFPGLGGNQSNQVKRSIYAVSKICSVRWPKEVVKPSKVTKSVNCSAESTSEESTR